MTVQEALSQAFRHHQAGHLVEAERLYRLILDDSPDHVDALHLLGLVARRQGELERAIDLIGKAVALHPGFAEACFNLGNVLMAAGRTDEAVAAFRRALEIRPDYPEARERVDVLLGGQDRLGWLARKLDQEYGGGRWAYLAGIHEVARYGVIAGYIHHLVDAIRVLDLGCGVGNLFPYLHPQRLAAYVGVDISQVALDKTRVRGDNARLVCSPLETFSPESFERFSVILFNEVLLYTEDPHAMMMRYRPWLEPDGIVIVSYYRAPGDEPGLRKELGLWKALDEGNWRTLDQSVLTNTPRQLCWRIRALRPAGA